MARAIGFGRCRTIAILAVLLAANTPLIYSSLCIQGLPFTFHCGCQVRQVMRSGSRLPLLASKQSKDPRHLTSKLRDALCASEVLQILADELDNPIFNHYHAGAACTRLARHKRTFTSKVAESPILQKLEEKLRDLIKRDKLNAQATANIFWAIASLQPKASRLTVLLAELVDVARQKSDDMGPQEVANTIWACAKTNLSSAQLEDLMPDLVARLWSTSNYLQPQPLANCIWACAKLKPRVPCIVGIIPVILEDVSNKMKSFNAQEVSNIVWATATLGDDAAELQTLLPCLLAEIPRIAGSMTEQHVANVLWALDVLAEDHGVSTEGFSNCLRVVLEELPRVVHGMTSQGLANSLYALARLQAYCTLKQSTLALLVSRSKVAMNTFQSQHVANAALGFSALGNADDFWGPASKRMLTLMPTMTEKELVLNPSMTLCAMAKQGFCDMRLLSSTAERLTFLLKAIPDWTICALGFSYHELDSQGNFVHFQQELAEEAHRRGLSEKDIIEASRTRPKEWNKMHG